jgi:type IV secretory pathway VirB10-like protein
VGAESNLLQALSIEAGLDGPERQSGTNMQPIQFQLVDDSAAVELIGNYAFSGASNSISQTGQQIVQRQLNIQPTLTIRPGFPVRVIVMRDLVLAPYAKGGKS